MSCSVSFFKWKKKIPIINVTLEVEEVPVKKKKEEKNRG